MVGLDSQPALAILCLPSEARLVGGLPRSAGISVGSGGLSQALETSTLTTEPPPRPLPLCCDCHRLGVGFSTCGILLMSHASGWRHFRVLAQRQSTYADLPRIMQGLTELQSHLEDRLTGWLGWITLRMSLLSQPTAHNHYL